MTDVFLLYINDLPDKVVSKLALHADDTTLFNSVDKTKSSIQRQQLCDTLNRDLHCSRMGSTMVGIL